MFTHVTQTTNPVNHQFNSVNQHFNFWLPLTFRTNYFFMCRLANKENVVFNKELFQTFLFVFLSFFYSNLPLPASYACPLLLCLSVDFSSPFNSNLLFFYYPPSSGIVSCVRTVRTVMLAPTLDAALLLDR